MVAGRWVEHWAALGVLILVAGGNLTAAATAAFPLSSSSLLSASSASTPLSSFLGIVVAADGSMTRSVEHEPWLTHQFNAGMLQFPLPRSGPPSSCVTQNSKQRTTSARPPHTPALYMGLFWSHFELWIPKHVFTIHALRSKFCLPCKPVSRPMNKLRFCSC